MYYVDTHRLSSRELLDRTLFELTADRRIKLQTLGENRFRLSSKKKSLNFEIPEPYTSRNLVEHSLEMAEFIDEVEGDRQGILRIYNAMLHSLDPHSMIMDAEQYSDLRQGTEGSFGGLGVVVGMQDDLLTVIKPIRLAHERAGINERDRITSIKSRLCRTWMI